MTSITDVEHALKGITFPKDKSEIVKYAQENKASKEIVSDLKALPDKTYSNAVDVAKEFKGKHMK